MEKTRWDYVGLEAGKSNPPFFDLHDTDGTTYIAVDTSNVYIRYNGQWYKLGA